MEREIKIRAWNKKYEFMMIPSNISQEFKRVKFDDEWYEKEDYELMQYTGSRDKNGKEIYEGDIVTFEDVECDAEGYRDNVFLNCGVVVYDEESMRFFFTNRQTVDMDDIYVSEDVEVIGNIYENAELLER